MKSRQPRIVVFLLLLLAPVVSFASVQVHEIAWMGTATSANDEWIELMNPDDASVDLTNWTINWALSGSSPRTIKLTGTLAGKGHYMMERTSDATLPSIVADLIYVGALSNSGETIVLKNAAGTEVDKVDGSDGWKITGSTVAGNNETKETAQRSLSGWVTAPGTPRLLNATAASVAVGITTTTNVAAIGTTRSSSIRTVTEDEDVQAISAHSSSVQVSEVRKIKPPLLTTPGRERVGVMRVPLTFTALSYDDDGKIVQDVRHSWSFGDGATAEGKIATHSYRFPGVYVVIVNTIRGDVEAVGRTTVAVGEPRVRVSGATLGMQGSYIELVNAGATEVNLGGWQLSSGVLHWMIPKDTLIAAKTKLSFPFETTKLTVDERPMALAYPDGEEVLGSSFTLVPGGRGTPPPTPAAIPSVAAAASTLSLPGTEHPISDTVTARLCERSARSNPGIPALDSCTTGPVTGSWAGTSTVLVATSSHLAVRDALAAFQSQAGSLMLAVAASEMSLATAVKSNKKEPVLKKDPVPALSAATNTPPHRAVPKSVTLTKVGHVAMGNASGTLRVVPQGKASDTTLPKKVLVIPQSPGFFRTVFAKLFTR